MIKAIIFDFDGTLLDTLHDLKDAINLALVKNNYSRQYSYEEAKSLIGMGTKTLCSRALSFTSFTQDDVDRLFQDFSSIYKQIQCNKTRPFPHVIETLDKLKEKGLKLAILSNKVESNTLIICDKFFKKDTFDFIIGQRKEFPLKPDPTSLKYLISLLGVKDDEILYVGDSDTDMKTADNLNLKKVAVTYGYRPESLLKTFNPDYLIDDFKNILDIKF